MRAVRRVVGTLRNSWMALLSQQTQGVSPFAVGKKWDSPICILGFLSPVRTQAAVMRALAEDAAFQVMLCIVAAVHFSALFIFFFFQGSLCQENISKQEWLSKCTYRF